jgi:hypothetical protein
VAKRVNRHSAKLLGALQALPSVCGSAEAPARMQRRLKRAERELARLQLAVARKVGPVCFRELNGDFLERDGRLGDRVLRVRTLREDLGDGLVICAPPV